MGAQVKVAAVTLGTEVLGKGKGTVQPVLV